MHTLDTLINDNCAILSTGMTLFAHMESQVYLYRCPPSFPFSIGEYMRHCIGDYQSFFDGIAAGRIDYGQGEAHLLIEQDQHYACAQLETLVARLQQLQHFDLQLAVQVRQASAANVDAAAGWYWSSLGRELQALHSHTLHCYALIAAGLGVQGVALQAAFASVCATTLR